MKGYISKAKLNKLITELYAEKQKISGFIEKESREKMNIYYKGKLQGIDLAMEYINGIDKPNFGKIAPSDLSVN